MENMVKIHYALTFELFDRFRCVSLGQEIDWDGSQDPQPKGRQQKVENMVKNCRYFTMH